MQLLPLQSCGCALPFPALLCAGSPAHALLIWRYSLILFFAVRGQTTAQHAIFLAVPIALASDALVPCTAHVKRAALENEQLILRACAAGLAVACVPVLLSDGVTIRLAACCSPLSVPLLVNYARTMLPHGSFPRDSAQSAPFLLSIDAPPAVVHEEIKT